MFGWLKRNRAPVIRARSYNYDEKLTQDEKSYMAWAFLNDKPSCPDCQRGHLVQGPSGGCSQNCMCNYCTSEFNLTFVTRGVILGERISNALCGDSARAKGLYGIDLD